MIAARIPAAGATIRAALADHPNPRYPSSRRYGERVLQMLEGADASRAAVDAFEITQILQLDHGFNASTFTARVVTSTDAPPTSAISAAMGALYGPKHGAADHGALEMAQEVGDAGDAEAFVRQSFAAKRRVMGMGHREYRVVDPRAKIIKSLTGKLAQARDPALARHLVRRRRSVHCTDVEQVASVARQCRVLQGHRVSRAQDSRGAFHDAVCRGARIRLDGAQRGAAPRRSHHPSGCSLRRPGLLVGTPRCAAHEL